MKWKTWLLPVVLGSALVMPAASFAAAPSSGSGKHIHRLGVCRKARLDAVAAVLGLSTTTLRQDIKNHQTVADLVKAKGMDTQTFKKDVAAQLASSGGKCAHPKKAWQRLETMFIRQAAVALGEKPTALRQAIFDEGFTAAVQAKGETLQTLIPKMAANIVAKGKSKGKNPSVTKVEALLWKIYDRMAGVSTPPPLPPAQTPPGQS